MSRFQLACAIALLVLLVGPVAQGQSPYEPGPHPTIFQEVLTFDTEEVEHHVGVYAPADAGSYPVVIFLAGLYGWVIPPFYHRILHRIASHGYSVVAPHHFLLTIDEVFGQWLLNFETWCRDNLEQRLIEQGMSPDVSLDFDTKFVMGHSSGGHVICEYLRTGCHDVKGQILLSPVDGLDPFQLIDEYCITPGEQLNYNLPTLIIAGGLDSVPGFNFTDLWPSCSPPALGNLRFFDGLPGTTWLVNATEYGHGDLLEPILVDLLQFLNFCSSNEAVDDVYRYFIAGEIIAFLKGVNEGDCSMFQYLEDPAVMTVPAEVMKKVGDPGDACGNGFCIWQPPPP